MNRTVHDVLAAWRQAERLQESLPEGSSARNQVAWEAMRLRVAYRLITDPERSTSEISRRCKTIGRVVADARAYMRDVERGTRLFDFASRTGTDPGPADRIAFG
jgi:hypothetical protein